MDDYDLFVSYPTLAKAPLARLVSEQLVAAGVRVWFAEFEGVLLEPYDRWWELVEPGIEQCGEGLAFTGTAYADSRACQRELDQMIGLGRRVLQVRSPGDGSRPAQLETEVPFHPEFVGSDLREVLGFVKRCSALKFDLHLPAETPSPPRPVEGACLLTRYRLDSVGWKVLSVGGEEVGWGTVEGPKLRYTDGARWWRRGARKPLFCIVHGGPETERAAFRQDATDLEMYKELRKYATRHLQRVEGKVRGVHLVFHSGFGQFALSYETEDGWRRKYSIVIPNRETGDAAEFLFTFGFPGSFREFCRLGLVMDRLVESFEWGPHVR